MNYLLGTVALVRHFTGTGRIGRSARRILDDGEIQLGVSVVSLMEVLYLSEKQRITIDLGRTLEAIGASGRYSVVDLTADILLAAETIDFPELHDRLILASAKWMEIPVISSDQKFSTGWGEST